jgi:hypothetical protein
MELDQQPIEGSYKIGDTFLHPSLSGRPKCHIRGFVDGIIVARYWRRRWIGWAYDVFTAEDVARGRERASMDRPTVKE